MGVPVLICSDSTFCIFSDLNGTKPAGKPELFVKNIGGSPMFIPPCLLVYFANPSL
jgi:hypothetical protein